ncbi:MAG: transglutaminase domain-containing protein, partial [Vicinamibacteria bacterium]
MRGAAHFRERALHEARRYGSDPLVLVRELLQNARDAGARTVAFETRVSAGTVRLSCRDDGHGLTFDEAERDLFTLYASRKTRGDAGRFGVGFWSVLLFDPDRLVVRSWPRKGAPWEAEWDGGLERAAARRPAAAAAGTEVVLERAGDADIADAVFDAAWRHARFLRRRDGRAPLRMTVNGRVVTAELALPAPSLQFRRRGLRGVVGLADRPRVELYAKGLLVRSGATLDDLLAPGLRADAASTASALPGAAAHFVLDADELDLLLSRGDARSDAALTRVVGAARAELSRLLDRQLARAGATLPGPRRWRAAATGTALAAAAAMAVLAFARPGTGDAPVEVRPRVLQASGPAGLPEGRADARPPAASPSVRAYRDPRRTYEGPVLDRADGPLERVALRYEPPVTLHLATMRVTSFGPDGRPQVARGPVGPYAGGTCTRGCVAIRMTAAGGAWTSLPVPTGHRLDPGSVTVGAAPARPSTAADGTPLVLLPEGAVEVSYRTGPADEPAPLPPPVVLPEVLGPVARALRALPPAERPAAAVAWVRAHVRDARAGETLGSDPDGARDGIDFAETALARGVGDCDVQNGIVSRLLQATGVPARLAIGYVGVAGSAAAGLHAWVEHRAGGGAWRVEDASGAAPPSAPAAASPSAAASP